VFRYGTVPVYEGATEPLIVQPGFGFGAEFWHGADGLGDVVPSLFEVPSTPPGSDAVAAPGIAGSPGLDAVNAIIAIVRAHPGEITLVALGRQ
jgi:inosine-uridine nucleoside N-ribohydrolase